MFSLGYALHLPTYSRNDSSCKGSLLGNIWHSSSFLQSLYSLFQSTVLKFAAPFHQLSGALKWVAFVLCRA